MPPLMGWDCETRGALSWDTMDFRLEDRLRWKRLDCRAWLSPPPQKNIYKKAARSSLAGRLGFPRVTAAGESIVKWTNAGGHPHSTRMTLATLFRGLCHPAKFNKTNVATGCKRYLVVQCLLLWFRQRVQRIIQPPNPKQSITRCIREMYECAANWLITLYATNTKPTYSSQHLMDGLQRSVLSNILALCRCSATFSPSLILSLEASLLLRDYPRTLKDRITAGCSKWHNIYKEPTIFTISSTKMLFCG